jgi:hypothetical protein
MKLSQTSCDIVEKVFHPSTSHVSEDYRRDCLLALERVQSEVFFLIYSDTFIRYQLYKTETSNSAK